MPYAVGRLRAVRPPTADSAALVSRRGLADVVLPPPRRLPVGGRRRWGLGRSGGGKSAPCAGIRSMPNLHNFAARPVELQLHIRTGAGQWYSQEQAIQAQPCGFAALQHERNHPVPLLEAGSASTHLAASVPLLFVFPRTFAA